MKTVLFILTIIFATMFLVGTSDADGLLNGKTPANYGSLPSGWNLVITQDFESGAISAKEEIIGTITTARAHTGSRAVRGYYVADASEARWMLSKGNTGSFTEIYLSFYEWVDSNARNSDEMFVANFVKTDADWNLVQEVITEWFAGPGQGWNGTEGEIIIQRDGDVGVGGTEAVVYYGGSRTWPVGAWVQWEIHYRPNTPGNSDGFIRVYKDGERWLNVNNVNLNGTVTMNDVMVQAGGVYTKLGWQVSEDDNSCATGSYSGGEGSVDYHFYPPGEWYTNRVTNFDYCRWPMGDGTYTTCNNQCPPDGKVPKFYRYFDDIIVMTTGGGVVPDTTPPYVYGRNPASGDTNVATTNRDIVAVIADSSGVDVTSIRMSVGKNGGAKTAYTCASGLTCTGSSTAYTATRTMTSDWTAGDVVQVLLNASDLVSPPNVMTQVSYSYQVVTTTGAPYPMSTTFSSVTWETSSILTLAPGSDLWPMTWAGDDNVYAIGGDGGGFNGTNTVCRARTTLARITGTPPSITGTNISGCKADGTGCATGATHDASCDSPYATGWNGVPDAIVAIDNTLWVLNWMFGTPDGERRLYATVNYGQTWYTTSDPSWAWNNAPGTFSPNNFLQFGKEYTGSPDNVYLYLYGVKVGSIGTYLARVPKGNIGVQTAYQFFQGAPAGVSTWGGWGNAVPVFYSTDGNASSITVSYFPVLGRYIAIGHHGISSDDPTSPQIQKIGVYESNTMYGPWKTVYYSNAWMSLGTKHGLSANVNPKWRSANNLTFYMTYSGPDYDNFNMVKGTLVLTTPEPPTGVTIGSYFYGPYMYGSMY